MTDLLRTVWLKRRMVGIPCREKDSTRIERFSAVVAALIVLAAPVVMQAQVAGEIEGRVTLNDGTGIEGVTVSIDELEEATVTDDRGAYRFSDIPAGTYHVTFRLGDRSATLEQVEVASGDSADIGLTVSPADLAAARSVERGRLLFRWGLVINGALLLVLVLLKPRLAVAPLRPVPSPVCSLSPFERIGVGALLVVGVVLRFYEAGRQLWFDEILTVRRFVRPGWEEVLSRFGSDNNHLLYSFLAKASIIVFGDNEVALRLPAILFGVAGLVVLLALARRVSGNREAVLALALLALSYHHIWFSQNARAYTGVVAAALVSTWFLLEALSRDRLRIWLAFAASTAVGLWLHLTYIFIPVGQAICVAALVMWRRRSLSLSVFPWRPAIGFLLAGTFMFQVYAIVLPQVLSWYQPQVKNDLRRLDVALQQPSVKLPSSAGMGDPLWMMRETIQRFDSGLVGGEWIVAGLLVLVGSGLVSFGRRQPFVGALLVLPGLLCAATALLGRPLYPRYFFHSAGFAVLLVVRGASVLGAGVAAALRRPSRGQLVATVVVGTLIAVSVASLPRLYEYPMQDFTGARDLVLSRLEPGDEVVALTLAGTVYVRYYEVDWKRASSVRELEAMRAKCGATWVLYTIPSLVRQKRPKLMQHLEREYELVETFSGTLGGGEVVVRRTGRDGRSDCPAVEGRVVRSIDSEG